MSFPHRGAQSMQQPYQSGRCEFCTETPVLIEVDTQRC